MNSREAVNIFKEICTIPHGTYNIDRISDYIVEFAKQNNLRFRQDEYKNVIIYKDASAGYEDRPVLMLQGHMDMVCVKDNTCNKDMTTEGLEVVEENDYIFARGTSLGGDDGIAVAMALAILKSDSIKHPALECVFTVNEEVGMDGAIGIDLSESKAKYLLNIDSEEEGIITVSCAGGTRILAQLDIEMVENSYDNSYEIQISGLKGGHSGTTIHEGKANSDKLMGELLSYIIGSVDCSISSIAGGEKDNAIPSEAIVSINAACDYDTLLKLVNDKTAEFMTRYASIEENITIEVSRIEKNKMSIEKDKFISIVDSLNEVPDGVISMCKGIDMVETSLNLGIMKYDNGSFSLEFLIRSSDDGKKEELNDNLRQILNKYNYEVKRLSDYPGWKYMDKSSFRELMVKIFEKEYGYAPKVEGVHAGLECGILISKKSDMEAVSIGPNILNIHSPQEKLDVKSVERTWNYIIAVMENC